MKNLFLLSLLTSCIAFSKSNDQNYISKRGNILPSTSAIQNPSLDQVAISITYNNGLDHVIYQIQKGEYLKTLGE
jgi:hypothetical protein